MIEANDNLGERFLRRGKISLGVTFLALLYPVYRVRLVGEFEQFEISRENRNRDNEGDRLEGKSLECSRCSLHVAEIYATFRIGSE